MQCRSKTLVLRRNRIELRIGVMGCRPTRRARGSASGRVLPPPAVCGNDWNRRILAIGGRVGYRAGSAPNASFKIAPLNRRLGVDSGPSAGFTPTTR